MPLTITEVARLGGQAKSEAKTAAVRLNAKKGGWPKGKPRKPHPSLNNKLEQKETKV